MNSSLNRTELTRLDRAALQRHQLQRLNALLAQVMPHNKFYQDKFQSKSLQVDSLEDWSQMPTSTKAEWLSTDPSGIAQHHTFDPTQYRRYHRTSGTKGSPMVILDTESDWRWWLESWQYVLDACSIASTDRIMMAFSFGPFIGFWSAHDACLSRGCMVIPCGGMSTAARIDLIESAKPTVLFSTPTYAMHLAQEANERSIDMSRSSIRQVFVAGEPGGSVPAVRSRLEQLYGASVMDHAGATEVGPWGFSTLDGQSMHVIESEFIAEYLPTPNEGISELVLTSLGRVGAPVLRYRTGDLVKPSYDGDGACNFVRLQGGVIGRTDDMIVVRGVNVFPTSIESIVRKFNDITEYRLTIAKRGAMDQLLLEYEAAASAEPNLAHILAENLSIQLNLRFEVQQVPPQSLPRNEGKARRIFDQR